MRAVRGFFFFFKQKTAYELRISDWSSDVCSSDLMALNAAMGMAAVILTNKLMLPVVLSWVRVHDVDAFRARQRQRVAMSDRLWRRIAAFAGARAAIPTLIVAAIALGWALIMYPKLTIGDRKSTRLNSSH